MVEKDVATFFYSDALPKFVQLVLKRRYTNEEHIAKVQSFLENLASMLPILIEGEYDVQCAL